MSRLFSTENDSENWAVRMSIGKRLRRSTDSRPLTRTLSIQKTTPQKKESLEKWKENLSKFVIESQKQCDRDARNTLETLEKWRIDTCARFDVILQHISNVYQEVNVTSIPTLSPSTTPSLPSSSSSAPQKTPDVESSSLVTTKSHNSNNFVAETVMNNPPEKNTSKSGKTDNSSKHSTRQLIEPVKSMPILAEDSLNTSLNPPVEKMDGKKIEKRRLAFRHSPTKNESFDVPIRKKSMALHSSVLAMSTNSPKVVLDMPNEQPKKASAENSQSTAITNNSIPLATTVKDKSFGINSNGKQIKSTSNSRDAEKLLYQKFLYTKRLVDERKAKEAQQQAANLVAEDDKRSV